MSIQVKVGKNPIQAKLEQAIALQNDGDAKKASTLFLQVLKAHPNNVIALYSLAAIESNAGNDAAAINYAKRAVALNPAFAQARMAYSVILYKLGRFQESLAEIEQALALQPGLPGAQQHKQNVLNSYKASELAVPAGKLKQGDVAEKNPHSAINTTKPDCRDLTEIMHEAESLCASGQAEAAIKLYQTWLEHPNASLKHIAYFNLGVILFGANRDKDAEQAYRAAISLNGDFTHPRINLGTVLERQGRPLEAVAEWYEVINNPTVAASTADDMKTAALNQIGRVQELLQQYEQAEEALTKSLAVNPDQPDVIHHWVHLRQKQCKWPVLQELPGVSVNKMLRSMSPLAMLAFADDPALQLLAAEHTVRTKFNFTEKHLSQGKKYNHDRIRVGYLSGDLCTHAVGLLLPEVFESHDKNKFEIYAYDYSREDGTRVRERFKTAIEHFVPVHHLADTQVAHRILEDEIDILVDLHGLSLGARPEILSYRPAPIQITFLGYIGTTAMPWIDYVIADNYSLPKELLEYYSEKPLYIRGSCLPGDSQREIAPTPSRADLGIDKEAFVFVSFNNTYKLNERMFTLWMRILVKVPESVLWLVDDNPWATANLKAVARKCGVKESRLIFSPRVMPPEYRARMKLADVFLDNSPYNAGSTASDALWMGLPLLTLSGTTFVSRMAGGLLTHWELPELVAKTEEEYVTKAIELAKDREKVLKLKNRLKLIREKYGKQGSSDLVRALEMQYEYVIQDRYNLAAKKVSKDSYPKKLSERADVSSKETDKSGKTKKRKVLIEGWRNINHSFAIVNQNQILQLSKFKNLELFHKDYPFFLNHWKQSRGGSGFAEAEMVVINGLKECETGKVDVIYRIAAPISPVTKGTKNVTFMVTELGLSKKSFVKPNESLSSYTESENLIVTPSKWSRDRLIDYGFNPEGIHILPHGVNVDIFKPPSMEERLLQREALGIEAHELVILNVGMPVWNKGVDILIRAAASAINQGKPIRLVLKNNKNLYGLDLLQTINSVKLDRPGLISEKVLSSIMTVESTLDLTQLRTLYSVADLYVSPYRAEGFNLPVIEAMACGTPVIVTDGGATNDFVNLNKCKKIPSVYGNIRTADGAQGKFLEPDEGELVESIKSSNPGVRLSDSDIEKIKQYSWPHIAQELAKIL